MATCFQGLWVSYFVFFAFRLIMFVTAVNWLTAGHQPGLIIAITPEIYTNKVSVQSIGLILE